MACNSYCRQVCQLFGRLHDARLHKLLSVLCNCVCLKPNICKLVCLQKARLESFSFPYLDDNHRRQGHVADGYRDVHRSKQEVLNANVMAGGGHMIFSRGSHVRNTAIQLSICTTVTTSVLSLQCLGADRAIQAFALLFMVCSFMSLQSHGMCLPPVKVTKPLCGEGHKTFVWQCHVPCMCGLDQHDKIPSFIIIY